MPRLKCTDGRTAEIPDWLYDEYHLDANGLGERASHLPPAYRMPLESAQHHNRAVFDCASALAETAAEASRAMDMIRAANRVTK